MLTPDERRDLLLVARSAVLATVLGGAPPDMAAAGRVSKAAGAFVTLKHRGALRGCIGHVEPDGPVGQVVLRCAIASAQHDPRFAPISPEELDAVAIELSILGPIEPINGPHEIVVGLHGLVVEFGRHRGLLLPQVAIEWAWSAEEFLAQTCVKAGLERDEWQAGASLFRFEAEVFGEE